jgi:hypothetical protein
MKTTVSLQPALEWVNLKSGCGVKKKDGKSARNIMGSA